ncbi:hypothetical protein [Nitrosopumilus cobalaminigenes]|uniref:hypothetical protein n=1 Tax=Nitrosopumilus cobalaminigenes TaxID=1470066 RepID=UPI0015C79EDF|nr:hypothetical protein [Nitrosopumilus cobalaminigenes]
MIIARTSNPLEILFAKICVTSKTNPINEINNSIENIPIEDIIIKNQNDNPAVTANDLNLGDEEFISDK